MEEPKEVVNSGEAEEGPKNSAAETMEAEAEEVAAGHTERTDQKDNT